MTAVGEAIELLFAAAPAAWDYLTEENAARSVAHLPALITAAAKLLLLVE